MKTLLTLAALCASTAAIAAPNLIPNGDFSAGVSGFTSDYTLNTSSGLAEGVYDVRTQAGPPYHPLWASFGDHTTGTGKYLIANGAADTTKAVWRSGPIAIAAHTGYFFEGWLSNVCCNVPFDNAPPALSFVVSLGGGAPVTLGTLSVPVGAPGIWYPISTTFNSGSATSATLTLLNAQPAAGGNDFGLDDVYLGVKSSVPAPEPESVALIGLGLAALAFRARRTR